MRKNQISWIQTHLKYSSVPIAAAVWQSAAWAASIRPNPRVEAQLDVGLVTVVAPALPRYSVSQSQEGVTLRETDSRYTALMGRARALVPWEIPPVTLSCGLFLSLYPGNASLALAPSRGPDGRYFSEYGVLARAEFDAYESDELRVGTSMGFALASTRIDYSDIAVRTLEPRLTSGVRAIFNAVEIFEPRLSPEVQFSAEAFRFGSRYQTLDRGSVAHANDEDRYFRLADKGGVAGFSIEAALGLHYANERGKAQEQREGALLFGFLLTQRTYQAAIEDRTDFLSDEGGSVKKSDLGAGVTGAFITFQGWIP